MITDLDLTSRIRGTRNAPGRYSYTVRVTEPDQVGHVLNTLAADNKATASTIAREYAIRFLGYQRPLVEILHRAPRPFH